MKRLTFRYDLKVHSLEECAGEVSIGCLNLHSQSCVCGTLDVLNGKGVSQRRSKSKEIISIAHKFSE